MDAGFRNVVEIGQYFITKDTAEFSQFTVSTLCLETKKHRNQKVGSEGTSRLGPYWKSQPVACKVNMEWKSELCL